MAFLPDGIPRALVFFVCCLEAQVSTSYLQLFQNKIFNPKELVFLGTVAHPLSTQPPHIIYCW